MSTITTLQSTDNGATSLSVINTNFANLNADKVETGNAVTAVSVTTANGISGTSSGGATPALTLSLGTITPSTVNGLTLASQSVGFTVAGGTTSKTLTVPLDATVSGTNTGDQDLSAYVSKATYDAHSILQATTDNTPVAITVGEQTVVGRATGGNITALAIDSDLSSVSANDDTIPSAKATKTALDAKLALAGGTMSGNITLGENTSIDLDPAGSADGKYSGFAITGTAGAALAFGDLCYLAAADSRWELADADASATAGPVLLGMCVLAAAGDGSATKMLLQGQIRADAKFPALTISAPAYVGETAGAIQTAIPTGADNVIRVVGNALTADELYFDPSKDWQISVA